MRGPANVGGQIVRDADIARDFVPLDSSQGFGFENCRWTSERDAVREERGEREREKKGVKREDSENTAKKRRAIEI